MSTTPPPPSETSSGGGTSSANAQEDWRATVEQSYRNSEVRAIAKILSNLEPGATFASKLRLAMQFENNIFSQSDSLADYRKRLQKRLKKFQKNYKPKSEQAKNEKQQQEEKMTELQNKYGETLRFIVKNAPIALKVMKEKIGQTKAQQLQVHTDNAKQWARELGLLENNKTTTKKPIPSLKTLEKLELMLQQRASNIRSHVIKVAHPDDFLGEQLEKIPLQLVGHASAVVSTATQQQMAKLQIADFDATRASDIFQTSLAIVQRPIPPISRQELELDNATRNAALARLEKVKAAAQVVLAFLVMDPKIDSNQTDFLVKCHEVSVAATRQIQELISNKTTTTTNKPDAATSSGNTNNKMELQDAWIKVLQVPDEVLEKTTTTHTTTIKSRVLLTPGRKPRFSNLLPELKRKGAKLVTTKQGSYHLQLDFGTAFTVVIHLVPLLVEYKQIKNNNNDVVAVHGIVGNHDLLGHVVEERLRYASAKATHVLRQCFAATSSTTSGNDFEVEISEATALLQFIQLVRSTYGDALR